MERVKFVVKDSNIKKIVDEITKNAFGNPIVFESTPTKDTLKANTWGIYSGYLFFRMPDGNAWKVQMTSVT